MVFVCLCLLQSAYAHQLQAMYLLSRNPSPPELTDKAKWSAEMHNFLGQAMTQELTRCDSKAMLIVRSVCVRINLRVACAYSYVRMNTCV